MPADAVFLDANGLVALLNSDDWLHVEALHVFEEIGAAGQPTITTNLVLAEVGNGLSRTPARALASEFTRTLLHEPTAQVIFVDAELFQRGLATYERYGDKQWGLVDCISFELMHQEHIGRAFTADRHFSQAGFTRLLRPA